jgi:hypothetical protein
MKTQLTRALCIGFIGSLAALFAWGSKPKPVATNSYDVPSCILRGLCP